MNANTAVDDKAMIEEILRRMGSKKTGISAEKVRAFVTKIGKEIKRTDGLSKEHVDQLLQQLKNGEL